MKKDAQFEVGNLRFNGMKPRARITARKFSSLIFWSDNIYNLRAWEVFLCLFPGKWSRAMSRKIWNNVKSEIL